MARVLVEIGIGLTIVSVNMVNMVSWATYTGFHLNHCNRLSNSHIAIISDPLESISPGNSFPGSRWDIYLWFSITYHWSEIEWA